MSDETVFTGTPEELAENDVLMAALHKLEDQRTDLEDCSEEELMEYVEDQNNIAVTAQTNIRAALDAIFRLRGGVIFDKRLRSEAGQ